MGKPKTEESKMTEKKIGKVGKVGTDKEKEKANTEGASVGDNVGGLEAALAPQPMKPGEQCKSFFNPPPSSSVS